MLHYLVLRMANLAQSAVPFIYTFDLRESSCLLLKTFPFKGRLLADQGLLYKHGGPNCIKGSKVGKGLLPRLVNFKVGEKTEELA